LCCGITRDAKKIQQAIIDVGNQGTGVENCMAAADYAVKIFNTSTLKKIFILVTDEMGNDDSRVEEILELLKKNNITLYVIGGESSFAQPKGTEKYLSKTGQMWNQDVDSGMESVRPEIIDAIFILEFLDTGRPFVKSGFGSYALSRLCAQTKGKYYFLTGPSYPESVMKSYQPALCSAAEYITETKKTALASAVSEILCETNRNKNSYVPLIMNIKYQFWKQSELEKSFVAAKSALSRFGDSIKKLESAMASYKPSQNTDRRWVANAELVRAQLYRGRIILNQYLLAVQELMKSSYAFNPPLAPESDTHWAEFYHITHCQELRTENFNGSSDDYRPQAKKACQDVIDHHPNTPWSIMAQRFMEGNFGDFRTYYGCEINRHKPEKKTRERTDGPKPQ
jgi:hypothetical protein